MGVAMLTMQGRMPTKAVATMVAMAMRGMATKTGIAMTGMAIDRYDASPTERGDKSSPGSLLL